MRLSVTLITTFFLWTSAVSSANTTVHQDPLEIGLFPGISAYLHMQLPHYNTVDSYQYYAGDGNYYKNDRLLLSKSLELYSESSSYTEIIEKYDEEYRAIGKYIEKFDLIKKVIDAIVSAHLLDIKSTAYLTVDEVVKKIKKDKSINEQMLMDIFSELFKGSIDIALETFGKDISLLGKYFPKILTNTIGRVLCYYDGLLKSATLINALNATNQTTAPIVKQTIKSLEFRFINDYVIKYKSNIDEMKSNLLSRIENKFLKETYEKNINNFWGLWVLYVTVTNDNKILFSKVVQDYDNPPFDGEGGWFAEFAKAGMEVNDYINNYGHGLYFSVFTPKLKSTGSGNYTLVYEALETQQVNALYFMPKNWHVLKFNVGGGVLSKKYTLLKNFSITTTPSSLKKVINLEKDGSMFAEKNRYVSFVRKYTVNINVFEDNVLQENEKMSKSTTDFVIPAYLGGMSEKDYSNKHIADLFNDRIIIGNPDGSFNAGKEKITLGEVLKVTSLALMENAKKDTMETSDFKGKALSKYVIFLKKRGVITGEGEVGDISYDKLNSIATRGYVAKLLVNIMTKPSNNNCKKPNLKYKNDWDTCSISLKNKKYVADGEYYRRDSAITRDEFFAIIDRIREANGARY